MDKIAWRKLLLPAVTSLVSALAFVLLLLSASGQAHAGTLGFHIASHHLPNNGFNNVNPGVYYIRDDGWTVGTYYNSERKQSVYAGYTWDWGWVRLQAGVITGYSRPVLPMVMPSFSLSHGFRLYVIPRVERGGASVVHLTWEKRI